MVPSREWLEFEKWLYLRVVLTNRTGVVAPMEIASATSPAGFVYLCSWRNLYATFNFQPLPPRHAERCQGVRRVVSVWYETSCFRKS
jgi:hypothetical protein